MKDEKIDGIPIWNDNSEPADICAEIARILYNGHSVSLVGGNLGRMHDLVLQVQQEPFMGDIHAEPILSTIQPPISVRFDIYGNPQKGIRYDVKINTILGIKISKK